MLIDVAISANRNIIKKEAEEILKYKALAMETDRMWSVKIKVIPVITGTTGTSSELFRKYLSNIPANYEIKELQKTGILGRALHSTAHALRKVLM
jgi:hypothetical protein